MGSCRSSLHRLRHLSCSSMVLIILSLSCGQLSAHPAGEQERQSSELDHLHGKTLILSALGATGLDKANQTYGVGLAGTDLLDCDAETRQAYVSLFSSPRYYSKLVAATRNTRLLTEQMTLIEATPGDHAKIEFASVLARRESAIEAIARNLGSRYTRDQAGDLESDLSRCYAPQQWPINGTLLSNLRTGLAVYDELSDRGYRDLTLRDTLGIAYASLEFDEAMTLTQYPASLLSGQIYADALRNTFAANEYYFLEMLADEMSALGLEVNDAIIFPVQSNDEEVRNFSAILRIIEEDLDSSRSVRVD